jgi:hypothetical protein
MGMNVLLIVHQTTSLPQLDHDVLNHMQTMLHDVVVNETKRYSVWIYHHFNRQQRGHCVENSQGFERRGVLLTNF